MLQIKGLEKLSTIDYPGKTCAVVFLAGCNFRCPFCQNPDLIENPDRLQDISVDELMAFLEERRKWIDGVCISGGEPCLNQDLPELARRIKDARFLVKLDTNGSNPELLDSMIGERIVDYVAMDIKGPPEKYTQSAGISVEMEKIKRSAKIIMTSGIDYEFRTTVVPKLFQKQDVVKIGEWLKGARRYFVQGFRPDNSLDKAFRKEGKFSDEDLQEIADLARPFFKEVGVRS